MTDLDDLERLAQAATRHNPTAVYKLATATDPQAVLALIERVRKAEVERDEAVSKAMVWATSCADANERAERAEAVIAEALAATKRGNLMTPPWVIEPLATYPNGADHDD